MLSHSGNLGYYEAFYGSAILKIPNSISLKMSICIVLNIDNFIILLVFVCETHSFSDEWFEKWILSFQQLLIFFSRNISFDYISSIIFVI